MRVPKRAMMHGCAAIIAKLTYLYIRVRYTSGIRSNSSYSRITVGNAVDFTRWSHVVKMMTTIVIDRQGGPTTTGNSTTTAAVTVDA